MSENNKLSFTEMSALVSGLTLVFSIVYEWAYMQVLGFDLSGAVTISDYFKFALGWLPTMLLIYLLLAMNEFLTQGIERGLTAQEIIASSPNPARTERFRRSPIIFFVAVSLLGASFQLIFSPYRSYFFMGVLVISLWGVFASRVSRIPRIRERYSDFLCSLFVVVPIMVATTLTLGATEAERDLIEVVGSYEAIFSGGERVSNVQVLRILDQGVLLRKPSDGTIAFRVWSELSELNKQQVSVKETKSIACYVFDWACFNRKGGE